MLRSKRLLIIVAVIIAVPVLAAAWYLLSPLFISKTVEEEFPLAFDAVVPANMSRAEVEQVMVDMAKATHEMREAMPSMGGSPSGAVVLKAGSFRENVHKGSGKATVYQGADGSRLLRLEEFKVDNGPDLYVIITPHRDPRSHGDIETAGYVELGRLKGNIGNQNYDIPANLDIAAQGSVVIYCKRFSVVFSVAALQ